MVYPEPCKHLRRRPQLSMIGIVPYEPSSTRVLIVPQVAKNFGTRPGTKQLLRLVLEPLLSGHLRLLCRLRPAAVLSTREGTRRLLWFHAKATCYTKCSTADLAASRAEILSRRAIDGNIRRNGTFISVRRCRQWRIHARALQNCVETLKGGMNHQRLHTHIAVNVWVVSFPTNLAQTSGKTPTRSAWRTLFGLPVLSEISSATRMVDLVLHDMRAPSHPK